MRKKSFLATLLFALALAIATAMLAVTGCKKDDTPSTAAGAYYLSVLENDAWTKYTSDSAVPTDKKFVKEGDLYILTVELEQGDSVKIAQVGTNATYGGDELFSTNTQLTKGSDNAISVGQSGTYELKLNVSGSTIAYDFTAQAQAVLVEIDDAAEFTVTVGGKGKQLTATATLDNDTPTKSGIVWEIADTSVATVSESGLVTAVAAGTTTVKAKHGSVESDPLTVNVNGSVTLNKETLKLAVNGEETLTYTANGGAVAGEWSSTDESVATVDANGKVTALKAGTTTVRLSYTPRTGATPLFAECVVTVDVPVTNISLSNNAIDIAKGTTATLTVGITPANATNKNYTYAISEGGEEFISVEKNENTLTVTPVAVGTATVTVTSADGNFTASCEVTVVEEGTVTAKISASSLSLNKSGENTSETLSVEVTGDTVSSVAWSSSEAGVATVSSEGVVTAVAYGTTTITATIETEGGQSIEKTCTVRVAPVTFFLYGYGGTWQNSDDAVADEVTFTNNNDGTFTLNRELPVTTGDGFRIGYIDNGNFFTSEGGNWVGYGYNHITSGNGNVVKGESNNIQIGVKGTYTITANLTGASPAFTVVRNSISVTGVELAPSKNILTSGNESENTATIALTVNPDGANYTAEDIVWECDNNTDVVFTLSENKKTATLKVNDGVTENFEVTITCTVKGVKSLPAKISVVKQGGQAKLPTSISFEGAPYFQNVNGDGGWSFTLSPKVLPGDADNKDVTYECAGLTIEGSVITAAKLGTYTITATAAADNTVTQTVNVTFYSDAFNAVVMDAGTTPWTTVSTPANYTFTDDGTHKIFTLKAVIVKNHRIQILPGVEDWSHAFEDIDLSSEVASINGKNINVTGETGIYTITIDLSEVKPAVRMVRDDTPSFTAKIVNGEEDVVSGNGTVDKNRWTIELEAVTFAADTVYTLQVLKGGEVVATVTTVANFDGDAKNSFANGENGFTCSKAGSYDVIIQCDVDGNATVSVSESKSYPYQLLINDSVVRGITLEPETEGQQHYTLYFSKDVQAWTALKFTVRSLDGTKSAKAEWATDFTAQGGSIEYTNKSDAAKWLYKSIHEKWNSLQSNNDGTMFGKIVFTVSESGDITIVSLTTADSFDDLNATPSN